MRVARSKSNSIQSFERNNIKGATICAPAYRPRRKWAMEMILKSSSMDLSRALCLVS